MSQVDLSKIASLTSQIQALETQLGMTTDPTVKAFLQSQIGVATQQLQTEATHAQSQVDSTNSMLDSLGLFSTLNGVLGSVSGQVPSILALFKK